MERDSPGMEGESATYRVKNQLRSLALRLLMFFITIGVVSTVFAYNVFAIERTLAATFIAIFWGLWSLSCVWLLRDVSTSPRT